MEQYKNLNGNSGVTCYETGADFIRVQFRNGRVYLYDYASAGEQHVERMKTLASAGRGLATYISQHVHEAYARKDP